MAFFLESDDDDSDPSGEVITLSVCRALTGEFLKEVSLRKTDTVMTLGWSIAESAELEGPPRLLHNSRALRTTDTLEEAGLRSGDQVLVVICQFQAVASASQDNTVRIWNAATGECQRVLEGHLSRVFCTCFSPDGRFLATGSYDRTAMVWDLATGQVRFSLRCHHSYVKAVAYSPDGRCIATGSGDCTAMVWDAETGEPWSWEVTEVGAQHARQRWTLQGHMDSLNSISYAPNGLSLVTGSEDRNAMVWDLSTGLSTLTLKGHSSSAYACFAPNGRQIATASDDKSAKVWDAVTGECLRTFDGHTKFIRSVSWSPDSRQVITASGDGSAKVWCAETGQCEQTLSGHSSFVYSAVFSPDGLTVMTGSADNNARIWDLATGGCNAVLEGHEKQVLGVAFGPAGRGPGLGRGLTVESN